MNDTIAAVSTPAGEGGIGIVRISGKRALSIADTIFVSKSGIRPSKVKTYTVHYGHIVGSEVIDEVILTVMRAPRSYTREHVIEINCHGGIVALRKVLELVLSLGARVAEPGEFTKRAFMNGRIDLAQAEAVCDVIKSRTESSMKVALGQLEGRLSGVIKSLKKKLVDILGEVEAAIDFSEEDVELVSKEEISGRLGAALLEIKTLIREAWKGIIMTEGALCVITGKPNAGKSSLMNSLLKRNRVIVTPIPGTTRDAVVEEINLNGVSVRIADTAGISRPKDIVEKHGIQKSRSYIKKADLIIFMLDLSVKWSKADQTIFNTIKNKNFILIANKTDLPRKLDTGKVKKITGKDPIELSLLRKKYTGKVEEAISEKLWRGEVPHPESIFVTNLRHKKDLVGAEKCLERALGASSPEIIAFDLREALSLLGSILGDTTCPDILDTIFSRFCIGK